MSISISRRAFLATAAAVIPTLGQAAPNRGKLVMLAGSPSHGPGYHEFNAGTLLLQKCLAQAMPDLVTEFHPAGYPKDDSAFEGATAIFSYADGGPGHPFLRGNRLATINKLMQQGVGLMCAHYAVEVPKDIGANEMRTWIGGCYENAYSCNPMWSPEYKTFPNHPVTNGVMPFSIRDEWYMNMRFRPELKGVTPLLTATPSDDVRDGPYVYPKGPYQHIIEASGRPEHMMWCVERAGGGRGVGFTGGHTHRNWGDVNFRKIVLNALAWICHRDVPASGLESTVSEADLMAHLDPKPK